MIGWVPSEDPLAQLVVTELVEPEPELDRVPTPVQSVLLDRCCASSIEDAMPAELFCVPYTGTRLPTPLPGVAGTCVPPPGKVAALAGT